MKLKKKSQATMFIIFGLIIVSLTLVLFYFKAEIFSKMESKTQIEEPVNQQIGRVQSYTLECMSESLESSLRTLGLQGGHLTLPVDEFPQTPYNMLSNSIEMFGEGTLEVPYWSYLSPNHIEKTQIPSKQDMEKDLENQFKIDFNICINDYNTFRLEGYDIRYSEPTPKITIEKEVVSTILDMRLDVSFKEFSQTFELFRSKLNIPLGKLYSKAIEIFEYENEKGFLEQAVLDYMAMYDEIPYSGIDFECTPKAWMKSEVIKDLKHIMALNLPTIKIAGTKYDSKRNKDKILVHDAIKGSARDVTVNFIFSESWPIMIDVIGENGEVLKGKPFSSGNKAARFLMPLFCITDYHFVYDMKFPLIVSLSEGDYIFQFALMGVIDNNQPKRNLIPALEFENEIELCNRGDTKIKVLSQEISSDGSSTPIPDADVSFKCMTTQCQMGKTRLEQSGYSLTTLFPNCVNAEIEASKEGYHSASLITNTNEEGVIALNMEKIYELPINILVNEKGDFRSPYQTEEIIFTFENKDKEYYTTYYYPSNEKIKLIAGNYDVSSILMVNSKKGFKFEKQTKEYCMEVPKRGLGVLFGMKETKCINKEIPETTLNNVQAGGGSFSWYADRRALETSNKINVYTNRGNMPQTIEELGEIASNQEQFNEGIKKPTFD
jgi:hypothetical protein